MIDKDILKVIELAGLRREAINDHTIALADHMLKITDNISAAATQLHQILLKRGML
jgi:hypothetical protein